MRRRTTSYAATARINERFGENLQRKLDELGWSQKRLAMEMGIKSAADLSRVMRGATGCSLARASELAKALKVPLFELVKGIDE